MQKGRGGIVTAFVGVCLLASKNEIMGELKIDMKHGGRKCAWLEGIQKIETARKLVMG
jgi:hypothetical protein